MRKYTIRFVTLIVAFSLLATSVFALETQSEISSTQSEITQAEKLGLIPSDYNRHTNREEAVTLLVSLVELTTDSFIRNYEEYCFEDTESIATRKAYSIGITNGVGDNIFAPSREITLDEYLVMLYRSLRFICETKEKDINAILSDSTTFSNINSNISDEAIDALSCLERLDLLHNIDTTEHTLITREQAMMLAYHTYLFCSNQDGNGHLPMFSHFEYYNSVQKFPGLQISEIQVRGKLFYKLENSEIGVIVLIDENEETAIISYNGKTLEVQIPKLFSSVDVITLSLSDLTGDGIPELYYAITTGGTGASETTSIIVDIDAMEIVPVEDYAALMLESLNIELVSFDGNTAIYRIESTTSETVQYGSINVLSNSEPDYFTYNPDLGTNYASLSNEDGILRVMVGFTIPGAVPGNYLGFIRGELTFDIAEHSFKVCSPFTVDLLSPQPFN